MEKPATSSQQPIAPQKSPVFQLPAISYQRQAGFTLVEMIVAVALFAVVMVVAVGALLSLIGANRKAQALQSVMNNLNVALDGMVRNVRMGTDYHCGEGAFQAGGGNDCPVSPGTVFSFSCNPSNPGCTGASWKYRYDATGIYCAGESNQTKMICKSTDNGASWTAITAPEVAIDDMQFYVIGTTPGDTTQPKVVMVISGTAGAQSVRTKTTFHIQATAVQRELDL